MTERKLAESAYATNSTGLFFDDAACDWQPTDFRHVGLHRTAGYILGVDPAEEPARLGVPDEGRPIPERYAVIAVQASSGSKLWNNPDGWRAVVRHLKARGLRVICIDHDEFGTRSQRRGLAHHPERRRRQQHGAAERCDRV